MTSSWMWADAHGGVNGASIDVEKQLIHWYDSVGCACGDSAAVQSFAVFREKGSPLGPLADDIHQEIVDTLAEVERQHNKL